MRRWPEKPSAASTEPPGGSLQQGSIKRLQPRRRRLTLFACFARAVRVFFGSREIVFLRLAAAAAFLTLRRAADRCLELAMARFCSGFYVPARGAGLSITSST